MRKDPSMITLQNIEQIAVNDQAERMKALSKNVVYGLDENRYNQEAIERYCGPFIGKHRLSPYEEAYTFERGTCIVWAEGYRQGEVYRLLPKKQEYPLMDYEVFERHVCSALRDLDLMQESLEERLRGKNYPQVRELFSKIQQRYADLQIAILRLYFGDERSPGLEEAEIHGCLINTRYEDVLHEIRANGIKKWLANKKNELGLTHIFDTGSETDIERKALNHFFYGVSELSQNIFSQTEDPIVLTHATYSHALTNVIQLGGLASKEYYERFGIKKRFGGEGGGEVSYTPKDLSFWCYADEPVPVIGGHGSRRAFEYPIMFGISKSEANKFMRHEGSMKNLGEQVVKGGVSLDRVTHVFVPWFKVQEVATIFFEHGWNHISILPLGQI